MITILLFCLYHNSYYEYLFVGSFMGVPFVFELRALMDWIWTDTSMTLSDWLKMEDIFAHIFQLKVYKNFIDFSINFSLPFLSCASPNHCHAALSERSRF